LANALFQLNQPDQAYAELQQAQKDNASLEPPAVTMARLWAGKKDSTKADQWMETALKQAPDDPKTLQPYAAWLLDRNRAEEAKAPADKAAQSGSVSDDLKFLRGLIAWHLKHYEEAERDFQALYTESPGNFTASNRLVLALNEQSDLGKRRRALQLAEMNARLYPKSSDALASLGWVYFYQGKLEQAEQYLHAALADGTANPEIAYFLARVIAERGGRDAEAKHYFKTVLDTPGRNAFRKESEEALARLSSAR
jgi:tetratricopeptide (TPR) repeat protein